MDKWTALPGLTTYPQAYLLLATTTRIQTAGVVQFCSAHVVRNLSALEVGAFAPLTLIPTSRDFAEKEIR